MSGLIRRIRRTSKKAAKYQFTATLQELRLLAVEESMQPKAVVVSFQHRRRVSSSKERTWEKSFSDPKQTVIVWPEQTPDTIEVLTTLYKSATDDTFEDKEWTIVVDEITAKNRRRPIAAVPLNMRLFIHDHPGSRIQLKLKLRPLSRHIESASIVFTLAASLLNEGLKDDISVTSSCSGLATREQSVTDGVATAAMEETPADAKIVAEIARVSDEMQKNFGVEKTKDEENKSADVVRPPWRVSSPSGSDHKGEEGGEIGRHSDKYRNPVQNQLNKLPTEAFFEVDASSRPKQVAVPPSSLMTSSLYLRDRSPRASTRAKKDERPLGPPQKIEGEDVLAWCQRVAGCYAAVKIADFSLSFRSGLALCALIHAYRSDLIGEYEKLDFSMTLVGMNRNVKQALSAASLLGVQSLPDASDVTTPDKQQIRLLVERLRRLLEGSTELPTPHSASDHRLSKMYFVSEDEKAVIADLGELKKSADAFHSPAYIGVTPEDREKAMRTLEREKIEKKQRSALSYETFSPRVDAIEGERAQERGPPTTLSPTKSREAHDPFASSSSDKESGVEVKKNDGVNEVDGDMNKEDLRDMTKFTPTLTRKLSATGRTSPTKREEYRKKAREMLSNPQAAVASFTPTSGAAEERREAARQLLEDAQSTGATFVIHSPHHHHQRSGSSVASPMTSSLLVSATNLRKFPSRTSLGGSATDLRRVEMVQPSPLELRKFKKRDPSPVLSRKIYDNGETPHLPAISASRDDVSSRMISVVTSFRRHGSMRADELKDLVYSYAQKYANQPASSLAVTQSVPTEQQRSATLGPGGVMSTPTRKVVSQWEKDVADDERTTREQETIAEDLLRITGEIKHREAVIRDAGLAPGSEDEQRLVEDLVRLANEKDGLMKKEQYYNIIDNLREATKRFNNLKRDLDAVADQDYCKTEEEKQRTDELMKKYMAEVEVKNDLMQRLFEAEDNLREDADEYAAAYNTGSLPRGGGGTLPANFVRGAPVSASRRIAQGVKNWLQG